MSQETIVIDENGKAKAIVHLSQDPITNRLQLEPVPLDSNINIKIFDNQGDMIPAVRGKVFLHVPTGVPMGGAVESLTQISTFETGIRQYKEPKNMFTKISLVSTWQEHCGIATYSLFLKEALESLAQRVSVHRYISQVTEPSLIHCQHEYGIFPESRFLLEMPSVACEGLPKIITWHTVFKKPQYARIGSELISDYVKQVDDVFDAHIVHNAMAKKWLMPITKKPIYIVPHGSATWPRIGRINAREKLGLPLDDKIIFAFGFSATTKGYDELASAVKELKPLKLIISGAIHGSGSKENEEILERIIHSEGVQVLKRYLSEEEVNLYAEAADLLMFNYYNPREIASASGAIHRVLYSGTPIIVSDDFRSADLQDGVHCLKFPMGDMDSLKACIEILLTESDLAVALGEGARQLAEATSWKRVAQRHLEIYSGQKMGEIFDANYYDEEYFIGKNGGKTFLNQNNTEVRKWSYYNPEAEWLGAAPVMEALKLTFQLPRGSNGVLKMLDVGCGRGTFTAYARDIGIDARGIDFSKWAIEHPYPKAAGHIQVGDVRHIDLPDGSFDLVFATDIMEHLYSKDAPDLDQAISEFQRISKRWIFYNIGTTMSDDSEYFQLGIGEAAPLKWQGTTVAGHVTVMSPSWWRKKLTENPQWKLRDDLVAQFRESVNTCATRHAFLKGWDVLANWRTIIITEKVKN